MTFKRILLITFVSTLTFSGSAFLLTKLLHMYHTGYLEDNNKKHHLNRIRLKRDLLKFISRDVQLTNEIVQSIFPKTFLIDEDGNVISAYGNYKITKYFVTPRSLKKIRGVSEGFNVFEDENKNIEVGVFTNFPNNDYYITEIVPNALGYRSSLRNPEVLAIVIATTIFFFLDLLLISFIVKPYYRTG